MSCWSWPSWQCAASGPWGRVGQACKLDAMLLLSSQGPFFYHPASESDQPRAQPATFELCRAPDQQKTRDGSKKRERKAFCRSLPGLSIISPPSFTPSFNRQPPTPPSLHTHCANPCPYSPQCLLHYWLQCFSAPQPYAQCWGPPVTQLHTN